MSRTQYSMNAGAQDDTPITWAVQRLILINVAVFALQLLTAPLLVWLQFRPGMYASGLAPWLGFQAHSFLGGYFWTPITYLFMHGGLMHLFMNMVTLFFFGPDVERALGTRGFIRFYLITGAVAVLVNLIPYFAQGGVTNVIGASGAALAVMVAFAVLDPDREIFILPIPWPITARAAVLFVFILNIIYSRGDSSPIAYLTHISGIAVGFAYMKALPALMSLKRERRRRDVTTKKKATNDKVGEAVDNIFKFDDRKRR